MERNTLLAVILIAVVFILTPYYFEWISPPVITEEPSEFDNPAPISSDTQPEIVEANPVQQIVETDEKEKTYTISTPLYTADISSKNGGSITSFVLHEYQLHDSANVNLINSRNTDNLLISYRSVDGDLVSLNNIWEPAVYNKNLDVRSPGQALGFKTLVGGHTVEKTLVFNPDNYEIGINIDFARAKNTLSQGEYGLSWAGGLPSTEKNTKDDVSYFQGNALLGDELHSSSLSSDQITEDKLRGATKWAAIRSKYFASALIPENPGSGMLMGGIIEDGHPYFDYTLFNNVNEVTNITLFLGPLQKNHIENVGVGLEKIMNFGWGFFRPIAKVVLWSLKKMYDLIPNYGVVLILFSLIIKIIVYPLTKKSYQSSREMQAIQPLIASLKEKYKHDPKRLNQEQMKLFKEHGVNPLGGCLPLLLQMPLLVSLFIVFRSTIELRGQPFAWWITDLSSPDTIAFVAGFPINILPVFMAVTMFVQQKMMQPSAGSPGQNKMMLYFMNAFFLFIFYGFPSGLNLYYALFNLFTILQQKFLTPAAK